MKKYVIDTCSLFQAKTNYAMDIPLFKVIWEKLAEMVRDGSLIISTEVYEEIRDDALVNWINPLQSHFIGLSSGIQTIARQILKNDKRIVDIQRNNSNADPFVIALAVSLQQQGNEVAVITEEEHVGVQPNTRVIKIPNVCRPLNIDTIKMHEFVALITKED